MSDTDDPKLNMKPLRDETTIHLHCCEFVAHLEITVVVMSLGERHHDIQVVLKTVDHRWYNQITGLVILRRENKSRKMSMTGTHLLCSCK